DLIVTGVQTCALPIFDVAKLRSAFSPVTVSQNMVTTDLAARCNLPARRHRPMKQRVETCYAHASRTRLHVFEKSGKAPDDFAGRSEERRVGKECRSTW